jgi:hypothetical protein
VERALEALAPSAAPATDGVKTITMGLSKLTATGWLWFPGEIREHSPTEAATGYRDVKVTFKGREVSAALDSAPVFGTIAYALPFVGYVSDRVYRGTLPGDADIEKIQTTKWELFEYAANQDGVRFVHYKCGTTIIKLSHVLSPLETL